MNVVNDDTCLCRVKGQKYPTLLTTSLSQEAVLCSRAAIEMVFPCICSISAVLSRYPAIFPRPQWERIHYRSETFCSG